MRLKKSYRRQKKSHRSEPIGYDEKEYGDYTLRSKCCAARVSLEGAVTKYYVCHECGLGCDVMQEYSDTRTLDRRKDANPARPNRLPIR